jgi:PAS domain S-box-containing protein
MSTQRRSPREIVAELKALSLRADADRDRLSLLHEIHVYQEELTVQNEELVHAQTALEETRDRFIDLYDFAPNGYLTLDHNGLILQINLTGALQFGKSREAIEGMPLLGFVHPDHRSRFLDFLRRCRSHSGESQVFVELMLYTLNGARDMQLICKPRIRRTSRQLFTAVIDVTDPRMLEAEREAAARENSALASRLISIQDEERHRIARDLHDNIGQQVTALRLQLDLLAAVSADDNLQRRVTQARSIVDHLDRQLDFLTGELRPVALDLGAISAIRQFVDEWSQTFGIAAEFRCPELEHVRMKPNVETHLYRVVQEALNNVAKHASAQHVVVQLARRDSLLVLSIADDGGGFDLSARARARAHALGEGLGLLGMRERAQIVNGTIEIQSTPGRGTIITLKMPAVSSLEPAD